jgi:hypothetical protein
VTIQVYILTFHRIKPATLIRQMLLERKPIMSKNTHSLMYKITDAQTIKLQLNDYQRDFHTLQHLKIIVVMVTIIVTRASPTMELSIVLIFYTPYIQLIDAAVK